MSEKLRTSFVLGLRFLFLTRYSWLLALALVALPPFALSIAPALLENLFVIDHPIQVFHISWIAMFCSASVIGTLRITALNAMDRFEDYRRACQDFHLAWRIEIGAKNHWYKCWDGWLTLLAGLATAIGIWYVIMAACIARTSADPGPAWGNFATAEETSVVVSQLAWCKAAYGGGLTLGLLALLYALVAVHQTWMTDEIACECAFSGQSSDQSNIHESHNPNETIEVPELASTEFRFYRALALLSGPGYFRDVVYRSAAGLRRQIILAPGHATLILSTVLFLGWYAFNYWSVLEEGKMPDEHSAMPALFFGLLSLLLVILILPGISFLLDRHRIPILPTLVILMAAFYGFFGTDHYYELNPDEARVDPVSAPTLDDVYDTWKVPSGMNGQRTLVVVDASGGGIQASAWTAQVLTGLHELYGDSFSRSIGLISAVSGGSVGSMFYLVHRGDAHPSFDPQQTTNSVLTSEAIGKIREAARSSGLEASCWGIAYPDTLRALFPPLAGRTIDRGWSIEQIWRERMSAAGESFADLRLSELGQLAARNQLPVVAFNSTVVETGQRLVVCPVLGPPTVSETIGGSCEFLREFPHSHLRMSTAARLSATFPYVTPVSRSLDRPVGETLNENPLGTFHIADGAYADNEGVVTSVDWINRLLVHYSRPEHMEERPFDRVLLIRIQAFPRQHARKLAANGSLAGWRAALLGPFDTMMHVRSASQTERGDLEINLLTRATIAEICAARERTEREFQTALAQVDQLQSIREEFRRLASVTNASGADEARQLMEIEDKLHMAEVMLRRAKDQSQQLSELAVESVVFDFQPVDQVRIPMSWKLTANQKRQLDRCWNELINGRTTTQPLAVLDRYFQRDARFANSTSATTQR